MDRGCRKELSDAALLPLRIVRTSLIPSLDAENGALALANDRVVVRPQPAEQFMSAAANDHQSCIMRLSLFAAESSDISRPDAGYARRSCQGLHFCETCSGRFDKIRSEIEIQVLLGDGFHGRNGVRYDQPRAGFTRHTGCVAECFYSFSIEIDSAKNVGEILWRPRSPNVQMRRRPNRARRIVQDFSCYRAQHEPTE